MALKPRGAAYAGLRAGFDFLPLHPSFTKQTAYFPSDKFAKIDSSSINFRPVSPEFSRGYSIEFTRLKSF